MVFLLNYLYSITYAYLLGREYAHTRLSNNALFFLLLPVFLIWLIISGGQDSVGTDYESYLYIFDGNQLDYYREKNEFLFAAIISLFNACGIHGQALFFVFYSINFIFFFLILKRLPTKQIFLCILLYITVTNLFNNQLNTLRQATAIYIGTYAAFLIFEGKKIKALFYVLVAALIHQSAVILIIFYLLKNVAIKCSFKQLVILLLAAIGLSFILQPNSINFLAPYLPEAYMWHILGGAVEEKSLILKVTKYIFVPIYILALIYFYKNRSNDWESLLFKSGWIAYCIRLSLLNLTLVARITDYFLILSIFPILLYINYLYKLYKVFLFLAILMGLSVFYGLKVTVFARGEYLYNSIYF